MTAPSPPTPPKAWKYLTSASVLLILLAPLWIAAVWYAQPPGFFDESEMSMKHVWWLVGAPVLVVAALVGSRWHVATTSHAAAVASPALATAAPAEIQDDQRRREYVLEVISLGVTLDKYRQGALWDAIKNGSAFASIREQDPDKYPWSAREKEGDEGTRAGNTLFNGAGPALDMWGTPVFSAEAPFDSPLPREKRRPLGLTASATSEGMAHSLFVSADFEEAERPDRLLERVFDFFDRNPDVPYVVLSSDDGMYGRNITRPKGTPPLITDGHYVPPMPDSSTLLVLALRERAEAMRKWVFDDMDHTKHDVETLNAHAFDRRLALAYLDFEGKNGPPNVPEWLQLAREFAQRGDIYPKGFSALTSHMNPFNADPPSSDFRPTPWFPLPWNKDHWRQFDNLKTLGYLHRPVYVPMLDKQGKPLTRRSERVKALANGWQQALQTLPEDQRKNAPGRVLVADAGNVDQTVILHDVMNAWAEQGGPELDSRKARQWINTDVRLGNTGASTWFMQMSIGVMGSYIDGGSSVAINMRDPNEASIVFVTPPPPETIKQQPSSEVLFKHKFVPAIDPANYQN